uniref:Death domain-containing protein n=1 Tax=Amphimedon queenslandica TaxID=400682 RepID=A0A1X7VLD9_AMPQE
QLFPVSNEVVDKWLKEGSVKLTVTRVNMHGPPGAGKTCALHLLLNEDPPTERVTDSTPIARPTVRATRVSVDDLKWEKVTRAGLLERLASDLNVAAASQPEESLTTSPLQQPEHGHPSASIEINETIILASSVSNEANNDETETVIQEIVDTIQRSAVQLRGDWLYVIDSGGQPAYQELLPLFIRTASLNIITLDLSQPLDKKLDFQYRIGGEKFSCGLNLKYSNREFFQSAVSSGAIFKPIDVPHVLETPSHPMHFVLGTHYDLISHDSLKKIDKELMSSLKPDIQNYVAPNERGVSIVFPVNTLILKDEGRLAAGQRLCQSIANCSGTSLKLNMPIRWFAFELWLQKVAERESRNVLIIDEVIAAGKKFKMSENDTKDALQYLHNVTIVLYFRDILPELVFVDPQPLVEILSRLLALTYVERAALHLITNPVPLDKDINKLHNFGFFQEKLLSHLKSDVELFFPPHFEPSHLIDLLIHLRVITKATGGDYFFPCALQAYTDLPMPQTEAKPLLIVWQEKHGQYGPNSIPVPQGMFPLLITHLLQVNQEEPREEHSFSIEFPPLKPQQYYKYRDALSLWIKIRGKRYTLHIINRYTHIEVYFVGSVENAKDNCPYIYEVVMTAIDQSADAINVKCNHINAFSCPKEKNCYCVVDKNFLVNCSLCATSAHIREDDKSYWCWFGLKDCSFTDYTPDSEALIPVLECPLAVNICDLDQILTDMKERHFPNESWFDLGLKLGLYHGTLKDIRLNFSKEGSYVCLRECLAKWLERTDGVDKEGGANWTTLVNCLKEYHKNSAEHIRCKRLRGAADQSLTDPELCPTSSKKSKSSC